MGRNLRNLRHLNLAKLLKLQVIVEAEGWLLSQNIFLINVLVTWLNFQ